MNIETDAANTIFIVNVPYLHFCGNALI